MRAISNLVIVTLTLIMIIYALINAYKDDHVIAEPEEAITLHGLEGKEIVVTLNSS